ISSALTPILYTLLIGYCVFVPFYTCFEKYGELKFREDGLFSFKKMLLACPSSAFPFTLASLGLLLMPPTLRRVFDDLSHRNMGSLAEHVLPVVYTIVYISFFLMLGRLFSRINSSLGAARVLTIASFLGVSIIPAVLAGYLTAINQNNWTYWKLIPLSALAVDTADMTHNIIHVVLGTAAVFGCVLLDRQLSRTKAAVTE
ncbi:MAG: hypothetical protein ABUL72_05675, partial [Armatimonadota bacterium]